MAWEKQKAEKLKRWRNTVTGCRLYGKNSGNNFCQNYNKKMQGKKEKQFIETTKKSISKINIKIKENII